MGNLIPVWGSLTNIIFGDEFLEIARPFCACSIKWRWSQGGAVKAPTDGRHLYNAQSSGFMASSGPTKLDISCL